MRKNMKECFWETKQFVWIARFGQTKWSSTSPRFMANFEIGLEK